MGSPSRSLEERKVALLSLQRLLKEAESSMQTGGEDKAFAELARAFERFQSLQDAVELPPAAGAEREIRRTFAGTLGRLLTQVDEAIVRGDPRSAKAAIEIFRKAVDVARRLDELTHASGVRRRLPDGKPE
jgi:hypothetical protein